MAKSFNNIRVGKAFRLINYGEQFEFVVEEIYANDDCRLKDLHTLEHYNLNELINYGRGEDFDLAEI